MPIKKKFPYRAAVVACNGGCRASKTVDTKCVYGCIGCEQCVLACRFGAIRINDLGIAEVDEAKCCLLYTSPSPRDRQKSRMPSSA